MALGHEEIEEIQKIMDERYVRQNICNDRHEQVNNKFANDDKRLELLKHDISLFKKIGLIIMTAAIGQFVISIFELLKGMV